MSKDPRLHGKPWPVVQDAQDVVIMPINSARTQGPPEERCDASSGWMVLRWYGFNKDCEEMYLSS